MNVFPMLKIDLDYETFKKIYENCTKELHDFLVIIERFPNHLML